MRPAWGRLSSTGHSVAEVEMEVEMHALVVRNSEADMDLTERSSRNPSLFIWIGTL